MSCDAWERALAGESRAGYSDTETEGENQLNELCRSGMFIEDKSKKTKALRRSEISALVSRRINISLLRSLPVSLYSGFYKHSAPSGLCPIILAVLICTIGVINSRAHVDSTEPQTPQEQ